MKELIILFDLDGTLARSEDITSLAQAQAASALGKKKVSPDLYIQVMGKSRRSVIEHFMQEAQCDCSYEEYENEYLSRKKELIKIHSIALQPGAHELLELVQSKARLGLVTSSSKQQMKRTLSVTDIEKYFEVQVSADDVQFVKPHPEPYLSAAEQLGIVDNVFVIEDTESGIASGKAAGFIAIAIRHNLNKYQDFSTADHEFQNLAELQEFFQKQK